MTCKTCGRWDVRGPNAAPPGGPIRLAMCLHPSSPRRKDLTWSHQTCRVHELRQDDVLSAPAASGATTGYTRGVEP